MKKINVLLISPTDPKTPSRLKYLVGGENTYTKSLLSYPPQGVSYTYHFEALAKGEIEYTFWQLLLSYLIKFRIFPMDSGYHCIRLKKKFDLIHCHGYNLKLDGAIKPPVVLGDSSSNFLFLRDYLNWSTLRITIQYRIRSLLHKSLGIFDRDLHVNSARLIVFSEFAKKIHRELGAEAKKIVVIPPGLPKRKIRKKPRSKVIHILFAGVWFERKGGNILLEAYKTIRKKHKHLALILLGPLPKEGKIADSSITHFDFVSYEKLLKLYFSSDIFVLVPPRAEGFGVVVLEAASFGIPSIVSRVYALPEMVEHGKTGLVVKPGSVRELAHGLEYLIRNPGIREEMGKAAKKRFIERYWIEVTNKKLLKVYKEVLGNPNFETRNKFK